MLDHNPPELPVLEVDLVVPTGARTRYNFCRKVGIGFLGLAALGIIVGLFMSSFPDALLGIVMLAILLGILFVVVMVAFEQGRQAELRREATLFLISEGSWQAFQVRGTRIEANATAMAAGGIAGWAFGGFVGRKVTKSIASRIDASTHPFEASLPFLLMIRSLAKCRSLEGERASSIMAFSPDPKADKKRGKIWVLSHPDCKYGISESSFDAV